MQLFLSKLNSRKLIMAILAAIVAGLKVYYPDLPSEAINTIVLCLMGYVATEGIVDAVAQLAKWLASKQSKI